MRSLTGNPALTMNRREFLLRSSLIAAAGLLPRSSLLADDGKPAAPKPAPNPLASVTEFKPLRRGVGIFTGRGGTIGWLVNKDAAAAIDTQFPDTAATFLAGLPGRGTRQLDLVINTHHHADHTSGNPVFKPHTKTIVAQHNVPNLQLAAAEKAGTVEKQVFADATFTEAWRHDLGDETVTGQYFGPAHTSGDAVFHFEQANVVHVGDLTFNRLYPVIDRGSGGRVRGWIQRIEEITKTYPKDAIYVFGHGSPKFGVTGGHADMLVARDYLSALLEYVQKEIAAGKTREQIVALPNFPGFPDLHAPLPNRLSANLGTAYDELTDTAA